MTIQPPKAFIFMRVGYHAGEGLDSIPVRKQRELRADGRILWGYGGPTLHPTKAVQPFVKLWEADEGAIRVLMATTESRAGRNVFAAREFSSMEARGSRFRLALSLQVPGTHLCSARSNRSARTLTWATSRSALGLAVGATPPGTYVGG